MDVDSKRIVCSQSPSAIKRKESDDFLRQQKLVRKNSGYLPVPCHQRASSTPVHMETTAKEPLHSNHRRFPSCIDSTTDLKKEFKKMSLDSSVLKEPLRSPKKCTSLETNINAKRPSKEESKSQFTVHRKDDASSNTLKATPELLAQLLKGSSEKLVAEQFERKLHQHPGESITLPTALLKCLVSYFACMSRLHLVFFNESEFGQTSHMAYMRVPKWTCDCHAHMNMVCE